MSSVGTESRRKLWGMVTRRERWGLSGRGYLAIAIALSMAVILFGFGAYAFFAVTEQFLAQHLGGRAEEIGSAVRSSSAKIEAGADLVPGLKEALGE